MASWENGALGIGVLLTGFGIAAEVSGDSKEEGGGVGVTSRNS